jgi:hypothetical protein
MGPGEALTIAVEEEKQDGGERAGGRDGLWKGRGKED